MKKTMLIAFGVLLSAVCLQAQTFHPFSEEGKTWKSDHYMPTHPQPLSTWSVDTWKIEGDTLIGGKTYKKLFCNGNYEGAVYDGGSQTFFCPKGMVETVLLYDFGLTVGETADVYSAFGDGSTGTVKAEETGYAAICGTEHRYIAFEQYETGASGQRWFEGVGSVAGPLTTWVDNSTVGGNLCSLRYCGTDRGTLYFSEYGGTPYAAGEAGYEMFPFCEEGKQWIVDDATAGLKIYTMMGDTIIAKRTAKRMFCGGTYVGAFFDKGYHTYFIAPGEEVARLAYNFSLRHFCTSRVWNGKVWCQLVTDDRAETCFGGIARNATAMYYLEVEDGGITASDYTVTELLRYSAGTWLEGVGSLYGPLENCGMPGKPYGTRLKACFTPSRILYDPDGYLSIVSTTLDRVSAPMRYRLDGRPAGETTHGVVIENGRKVLR